MGCNFTKAAPPEEMRAAVGTWQGSSDGATVTFVLFGEGSFCYRKETFNSTVSMQGPITRWSGGSFDCQPCGCCCRCCSGHFELEKPTSHLDQGLTMVVNGITLFYVGIPQLIS